MADPTLRVKQTLDNSQFKKGLKDSQKFANSLQNSMKAVGGAIAAAFSVGAIVNFAKASVQAYSDQIKSEAKLVTALKGRQDIADALIAQANKLQGKTLFSDEDIINGQALLATFTKSSSQLKELTPLVLDYAQAFGMDVASAAKQVGKALVSANGAIGKSGIEAEGAAGSHERFASLVEQLSEKFKDQAENAIPEQLKKLREVQVSTDEFKEAWGRMVLAIGQGLPIEKFTEGMDYMTWRLQKFSELGGGFGNWWKRFLHLGEFSEEAYNASQNLESFESSMSSTNEVSSELSKGITTVNEDLDENAEAAEDAAKAYQKYLEETRKTAQGTDVGHMTSQTAGAEMNTGRFLRTGEMQFDLALPTDQLDEFELKLKELPGSYTEFVDSMSEESERLADAFNEMGAAVGSALGEFIKGEATFGEVAENLLQSIIKIVAGYLTESVAASFAGGASAGGPAAPFTGAAAAAAALSMFGALVPALMAEGGVVPGGYPGDTYPAMLSSGEVVVPPGKLDSVIGKGGQTVRVVGQIRGQDIHFVNEKQTSKLNRYR